MPTRVKSISAIVNVLFRANEGEAGYFGFCFVFGKHLVVCHKDKLDRERDILIVTQDGAENVTAFPFGPEHNII